MRNFLLTVATIAAIALSIWLWIIEPVKHTIEQRTSNIEKLLSQTQR